MAVETGPEHPSTVLLHHRSGQRDDRDTARPVVLPHQLKRLLAVDPRQFQIQQTQVQFSEQQIADLAAYVASLAPGPPIPDPQYTDPAGGDISLGGQIFRVNCAMCHNFAGAGGALTRGKFAPNLMGVSGKHVYEAMVVGPQSMPVFSDTNIPPKDKQNIIAYLNAIHTPPSPGGLTLGNLGTVPEGLFVWVVGLTVLIGCAVWLGSKSA